MNPLDFEQARFNMIEQQIRPWDVLDSRVLDVLAQTPREDFVPEAYRTLAFSDISIPLGLGEFMMPPRLEGRLLQSLNINASDRILEVGTGSAYLTACLSKLGNSVVSSDIHSTFGADAVTRLGNARIRNVELKTDDAALGWNPADRYDVIAITGSLPLLHRGFHDSLTIGGRLCVIVGEPPIMEALLITRISPTEWAQESMFDTSVPALVNAQAPAAFAL